MSDIHIPLREIAMVLRDILNNNDLIKKISESEREKLPYDFPRGNELTRSILNIAFAFRDLGFYISYDDGMHHFEISNLYDESFKIEIPVGTPFMLLVFEHFYYCVPERQRCIDALRCLRDKFIPGTGKRFELG